MSASEGAAPVARPAPSPATSAGGWSDPATVIAVALTAVWGLGALAFWIFVPPSDEGSPGNSWPAVLMTVILPVALIWVAAIAARSARVIREESARLAAAIDAVRMTQAQQAQSEPSGPRPPIEAKLEEIAQAQRQAGAAIARLAQQGTAAGHPQAGSGTATAPAALASRSAPQRPAEAPAAPPSESQPRLALEAPGAAEPVPISAEDFIRALHFPEDERDGPGFRALRLGLKDRFSAGLIRSAQDVLTLLAEDGIYMDDLAPDLARPEVWRRFAHGERGRGIAALGGVRDRSCLALTAGRMRQDPVFRDVAHHFLRKFDHTFAAFEPRASDAEIVALSETRTARAFMLLGRVAGTFD